jgi:photosystem II stability/assembly factor-like uncharacterized protein
MILQAQRRFPLPVRRCFGAFLICLGSAAAHGANVVPRMMLLDGVLVGNEIIAVGERGTILRSATGGRTWERVASPAAATLTAIAFAPDAKSGWIVGHDALILASRDGGRRWELQYQGDDVQDSFLDVLALDSRQAIAIGGYGLFASTADGGRTWTRRQILEDDSHLNRITRGPAGTLYLAGEHGTLLRSVNGGLHWTSIRTPYSGSFYGILPLDARRLLAHGLRGHLYQSNDDGDSWRQLAAPRPVLLATALKIRDNRLVLGGQARGLIVSCDRGRFFAPWPKLTTAVATLLELPDGSILALGEAGATRLPAPPRSPEHSAQ